MIYASCFNYIPVTFSWTKVGRAQPKAHSACRVRDGSLGRSATPTPQNTALGEAREDASKDATHSHRAFLLPPEYFQVQQCFSAPRRRKCLCLIRFSSQVKGRDPERHVDGSRGSPHPSPGTARGRPSLQPCSPPCLSAGVPTQTFPSCTGRESVPRPLHGG